MHGVELHGRLEWHGSLRQGNRQTLLYSSCIIARHRATVRGTRVRVSACQAAMTRRCGVSPLFAARHRTPFISLTKCLQRRSWTAKRSQSTTRRSLAGSSWTPKCTMSLPSCISILAVSSSCYSREVLYVQSRMRSVSVGRMTTETDTATSLGCNS